MERYRYVSLRRGGGVVAVPIRLRSGSLRRTPELSGADGVEEVEQVGEAGYVEMSGWRAGCRPTSRYLH